MFLMVQSNSSRWGNKISINRQQLNNWPLTTLWIKLYQLWGFLGIFGDFWGFLGIWPLFTLSPKIPKNPQKSPCFLPPNISSTKSHDLRGDFLICNVNRETDYTREMNLIIIPLREITVVALRRGASQPVFPRPPLTGRTHNRESPKRHSVMEGTLHPWGARESGYAARKKQKKTKKLSSIDATEILKIQYICLSRVRARRMIFLDRMVRLP